MSLEALETVISKAIDDEEFRSLLLSNPEKALADYDLADEERSQLSNLDEEFFEAVDLEDRISRWGSLGAKGI